MGEVMASLINKMKSKKQDLLHLLCLPNLAELRSSGLGKGLSLEQILEHLDRLRKDCPNLINSQDDNCKASRSPSKSAHRLWAGQSSPGVSCKACWATCGTGCRRWAPSLRSSSRPWSSWTPSRPGGRPGTSFPRLPSPVGFERRALCQGRCQGSAQ